MLDPVAIQMAACLVGMALGAALICFGVYLVVTGLIGLTESKPRG
jgi:hypothetical protein